MSDPQGDGRTSSAPNSPGRLAVPGTTSTTTTTTTTVPGSGAAPRTTTTTSGPLSSGTTTITNSRPPQVGRPRLDSWQQPSIRIRRNPSAQNVPQRPRAGSTGDRPSSSGQGASLNPTIPRKPLRASASADFDNARSGREGGSGPTRLRHETRTLDTVTEGNRRRSSSDPNRLWNASHDASGAPRSGSTHLQEIVESQPLRVPAELEDTRGPMARRLSAASDMLRFPSFRPSVRGSSPQAPDTVTDGVDRIDHEQQYDTDLIDILDTVDPEVSTLNTLNNVQNSLFIPDLGRYINRRPTYNLTRYGTKSTIATVPDIPVTVPIDAQGDAGEDELEPRNTIGRTYTLNSLTSRLDDNHFAVLPHGERLNGWTKEERDELNDHVRHLLHSRREKFRRSMKGFGQYVRKPLGLFVTVYATLITLFGLAWVLFLIGWVNVGGRKDYIVNVIDNVLVALFAIMGDGLAPFRAVDTYHMSFIAHYHHLTWSLRKKRALPKLKNENDLPDLTVNNGDSAGVDCETAEEKLGELSVLTPEQQKKLVHHQKKFSRSHTFYKPHETETHFAFPLRLLVAVVVLLDCHSCLQIALGTCTWAISYKTRPFALTTVILCCSITCNITAGVLITLGDHKTRKKDVLERMFRQELTSQAIHKLEKKKEEEKKKKSEEVLLVAGGNGEANPPTPPPKE